MRGMHPYGGEQRCPFCKTRRKFIDKKQGTYSFSIMCVTCRRVISPLTDTIFGHTKMHLSVWLKAMYILKVRQPDILQKDLAASLNVRLATARSMKRKVLGLRENAFELLFMKRMEAMVAENFYYIFNESVLQTGS